MNQTRTPQGRLSVDAKPVSAYTTKKCYRKVRHATFAEAVKHWQEVYEKPGVYDPVRLVIYPCEFCGGWHVGHLRKDQMAGGLVG